MQTPFPDASTPARGHIGVYVDSSLLPCMVSSQEPLLSLFSTVQLVL